MNIRVIIGLFFMLGMQGFVMGQSTNRPMTPWQAFEVQRGEVENFKTLTYRYEVAWEEMDLQSTVDLRAGLIDLMQEEVNQANSATTTKQASERSKKMKENLDKMRQTQLNIGDSAFGTKAEKIKKMLNEFIKLLEDDLSERLVNLRDSHK